MCAQPSSDPQSEEEESFWEKPEGKQKMGEIEDMKELISEAKKLKDEQEQKQKDSGDEGSRDLREEIAKVTTFILSQKTCSNCSQSIANERMETGLVSSYMD